MTFVRIFISDLDGTILGTAGQNQRFSQLWSSIPEKRKPILVYSTGRLFKDARQTIGSSGLPCPDYCICGVGTQIFGGRNWTEFEEYTDLLRKGWNKDIVEDTLTHLGIDLKKQSVQFQSEFKSSWYLDNALPDQLEMIQTALGASGTNFSIVYSSSRDLDVLPGKAGKGSALKWLITRVGFTPGETLVAGDSGNDKQMFLIEGVNGIIVGNAKPELIHLPTTNTVYQSRKHGIFGVLDGLFHFGIFKKDELLTQLPMIRREK